MLSKSRIKYIKSLQVKKYRQQEQCFVVEGDKSVAELLGSDFQIDLLVVTERYRAANLAVVNAYRGEVIVAATRVLGELGEFQTNEAVLAVARMKPNQPLIIHKQEFALVLDDIRDPGNLGTIIRIADWYGVSKIVASHETADFYNPKVIHASMGSFTRVKLYYTNLPEFLSDKLVPVYGAFMEGEDVHRVTWEPGGLIVIGNEAHGISGAVERYVTKRITIPKYGGAESLNAAVATAVICDNVRRKF
jgi:RNA methyltransferase, TrmH family